MGVRLLPAALATGLLGVAMVLLKTLLHLTFSRTILERSAWGFGICQAG